MCAINSDKQIDSNHVSVQQQQGDKAKNDAMVVQVHYKSSFIS